MKKFLSLLLVAVLVLSFASCSKPEENKADAETQKKEEKKEETKKEEMKEEKADGIKIAFASNSYSDKWQTYLTDAAKKYAADNGIELVVSDGKDDAATQLNNVETAIADGVQAVVIVMVDPQSPAPFIAACKEAGIPLIAANRKFEGADVFVGSDDVNAGNIQGEYVVNKAGKGIKAAILQGPQGHASAEKRTEGNKQIFDANDIEIVFEEVGKWDRAKGMEIAENWLSTGEDIKAIVSNNDEMAIGAINALKAAGKLEDVVVAGVDATPDALEYVKNGELDVTVFQNPFGQGAKSIEAAVDKVNGKDVPQYVDVPFEEVTIDNVDTYIAYFE